MLRDRRIVDLDFNFASFLHGACFWRDLDVLVDLALPHEIEVELTAVRQDHSLALLLIDEELPEVEVEGLSGLCFHSGLVSEHGVVDLVAFALDIQDQGPSLPLDVAGQVIVVLDLVLRLEVDLNGQVGQGWHHS